MVLTLIVGGIVGGVAFFIWGALSWMLLPWHHATFSRFHDEDEVARVIERNTDRSAVYGVPAPPKSDPGMSAEEKKAAEAATMNRMKQGPLLLAVVTRGGLAPIWLLMIRALVVYMLSAMLVTWILMQTTGFGFLGRAGFVGTVGLAAGFICRLPDWNWHGYAASYTAVNIADAAIGWFLTGLAIAAVVRP